MQFSLISTSLLCFTTWMNLVQTTIGSVAHCPCVMLSDIRVPHSNIKGYTIQKEGPCLFTAIAFRTNTGKTICSTENKWTKHVIQQLAKRQNKKCPTEGSELTTPATAPGSNRHTTIASTPGSDIQSTKASAPSTTAKAPATAPGSNQQTTIASTPGSDTQSTKVSAPSTPPTAPSNPTSLPGSEPTSTPTLAPSTTASTTSTTPASAPSTMTSSPVPEKSTPNPTSAPNNIAGASGTRSASDRIPAKTTRGRQAFTRRHLTTRRRRNKRKIREWQKRCAKTSK